MSSTTLRARVALAEIEALGLRIEDLLAVAEPEAAIRPTCPTLRDYVPVVSAAYPPRTRRTYNSYWRLAVEFIGDMAIERVTAFVTWQGEERFSGGQPREATDVWPR